MCSCIGVEDDCDELLDMYLSTPTEKRCMRSCCLNVNGTVYLLCSSQIASIIQSEVDIDITEFE